MTQNIFNKIELEKRKKIYTKIKKKEIKNINNLFFYGKIINFKILKNSVDSYLSGNLYLSSQKKYLNLNKSIKDILKLTNITPNGIVHPTEQTSLAYNFLVKKVFESIKFIVPFIESAAMPIVRVKKSVKLRNNRPYATTKLHSDAWVGQYGDAIISMGIDGDLKSNGVEFFIPNKTTHDFFSKIKNYDEGLKKFELAKKIKKLSFGEWSLFDHAILHKTMYKKNSKPRISIDIAVKIKSKNKRKVNFGDKKRFDYISIDKYLSLGSKSFIKVKRKILNKKIITIQKFHNFN